MTVDEIIKDIRKHSKKIFQENPGLTGIWWEFFDLPVEELRAAAKKYHASENAFYFNEDSKRMVYQYSYYALDSPDITCFFYSPELKVKQHFVIDDAVKNV